MAMLDRDLFGEPAIEQHKARLSREFEYPPFSVLSARDGWWQERKRQWLALGIKSEVGRGSLADTSFSAVDYFNGGAAIAEQGGSIFDPVLTELAYRWFCPDGGQVLDPFAGGSVRGVVASVLGYEYTGFELRPEQVEANRAQAAAICPEAAPRWCIGDSAETVPAWGYMADFLFSCPPYGDLEVYSDLPGDISNMEHAEFLVAYRAIIGAACNKLKPDRFACFAVGDFRCKKGFYRNFPGETVAAFEAAGLRYYGRAVLVTPVGTLPIRTGKQFRATRKLGNAHQDMLIFVKGCPRAAATACGPPAIPLTETALAEAACG